MAYIGREPTVGNFQVCDAISVVNGQAAYTMQVSSVNVSPETANHMLVSLNGVLQAPTSSYTVSGSTITFASNLVTGDVINFIHILGSVLDLGVPSDSTVSLAKLTATGTKDATTFLRGDNTFAAAGETNTPAFIATKSSSQSISDGAAVKVTFQAEVYDSNAIFDLSNDKVVFPSTGKYLLNVRLQTDNTTDGEALVIRLYKEGSFASTLFNLRQGATGDAAAAVSEVVVVDDTTDFYEIYAKIDGGGTLAGTGQWSAFKLIT